MNLLIANFIIKLLQKTDTHLSRKVAGYFDVALIKSFHNKYGDDNIIRKDIIIHVLCRYSGADHETSGTMFLN